ncbi:ABC-F family ATP-binding cassette domain-containing protein [Pendulispora albinea]|uniref:ABC-F family ATP-binding cassette domain-containing protein n=1 Tax=Pendulispora albinea TaxID=2741071 RepID=A0ABZ2LUA0_9BACT
MPILSARGLHKAYGARPLLTDATFTLKRGEKAALLGPNGTGKSTLLRLLAGIEPADSGLIDRRRDASMLYLSQEPVLDGARNARELVSEKLGQWSGEHEVDEMLDRLGVIDRDRPVATLSGGERRRVALARLFVARPDLALLDEPTNHLDADTIAWLETYLRDTFPGAVLMVTHDRYVLDAVATRVFELDAGRLTEFTKRSDHLGAYADYLEQRAERDAQEERVERNRQNLLRREIEWLRRGPKARSTKQKARIERANAKIAEPGLVQRARVDFAGLEEGAGQLGGTILDLENVTVAIGDRTLVRDLTLNIVRGERIGVVGPNGAGKTSLLRVVNGEVEPLRGTVKRGTQTRIALFDQSRAMLRDDWSVLDNVAEREGAERTGAGTVSIGDRTMDVRTYLELFMFDGQSSRRKVSALSGGERARVALALSLKTGANVLLLDEPTNDLDIVTLSAVEELLESWPGCAIVVSHDRWFLDRVATSILAFEGDGKVTLYGGNWSSYRERLAQNRAAAIESASATKGASSIPQKGKVGVGEAAPSNTPAAPEKKKLTYAERLELEKILDVIAEAEVRLSALEAKLADGSLWAKSPDEAKETQGLLDAARAEVERLTARWEDLESRSAVQK